MIFYNRLRCSGNVGSSDGFVTCRIGDAITKITLLIILGCTAGVLSLVVYKLKKKLDPGMKNSSDF